MLVFLMTRRISIIEYAIILTRFTTSQTIVFLQVSGDGVYMFCGCGNKVNVLEISTGKIHCSIGQVRSG